MKPVDKLKIITEKDYIFPGFYFNRCGILYTVYGVLNLMILIIIFLRAVNVLIRQILFFIFFNLNQNILALFDEIFDSKIWCVFGFQI